MKRFEYEFETNVGESFSGWNDQSVERMVDYLNVRGQQGWELVAVSSCGEKGYELGYWFKREVHLPYGDLVSK